VSCLIFPRFLQSRSVARDDIPQFLAPKRGEACQRLLVLLEVWREFLSVLFQNVFRSALLPACLDSSHDLRGWGSFIKITGGQKQSEASMSAAAAGFLLLEMVSFMAGVAEVSCMQRAQEAWEMLMRLPQKLSMIVDFIAFLLGLLAEILRD